MLKRLASALLASVAIGAPALAAPASLDRSHQHLWTSLERQNVQLFINPDYVCGSEDGLAGAYFYANSHEVPVIVICQDNRTGEEEVAWTENDLDTLRHEAVHYLQDCIDGDVGMTMDPYHDGDGWAPGTDTHLDVIRALGYENALRIETVYRERGADDLTVRLEHEAFLIARDAEAGDIGETINQFCPSTRIQ